MHIESLEVIPIALPFRETYRTASGQLDERSMVVIAIHSDAGGTGFGEAVPLSLRGGPSLAQVAAELASCGGVLTGADSTPAAGGDPAETRAWIWGLLQSCRALGVGSQTVAALDIGLHDLAGRLSGLPVWRLLGVPGLREVQCNASIDAAEPGQAAWLAGAQRGRGFETFKVKVGSGDDVGRIAAVRDAVGGEARIRIDANGAWDVGRAQRALSELAPYGLELVEQPCAHLAELAELRIDCPIPIIADESVASPAEARGAALARACDAVTIKLAKVGGPLEALRVAALVPSYLSSALDGPIGIAAAIHTAQALPSGGYAARFAHGLATLELFSHVYAPADELVGPTLRPPSSPGLGISVHRGALEELRLR